MEKRDIKRKRERKEVRGEEEWREKKVRLEEERKEEKETKIEVEDLKIGVENRLNKNG